MESIDGQLLDSLWVSLTEPVKASVADEVAEIIVRLSEINLGGIGGLTLKHDFGPTVEGHNSFRGRISQFLRRGVHHHIATSFTPRPSTTSGPHPSTHAYVLSCYDQEIHYYTHASAGDFIRDHPKKEVPRILTNSPDQVILQPITSRAARAFRSRVE